MEELDKAIENELDGAASEGETPEEQLARQEQELSALRDQVMRQAAEFQNYRRRTEQEKDQMAEYGRQSVVMQLLDVVDDFRRTLDAAEQVEADEAGAAAFKSLHTGVAMVYGKLLGELAKLGVEQIDAVGKPFDESEHEALMSQPVEDGQQPGEVVGEIQAGYRMGDRVIRHARVVVTA